MTTNNENHIVTPTYQTILMQSIGTIIERMNNDQPFEAWLALRNLYRWLPKECKEEVKETYEKINQKLYGVNQNNTFIDIYVTNNARHIGQLKTLRWTNEILCDKISESMRQHNWLDRDGTIKPRFENKPQLQL